MCLALAAGSLRSYIRSANILAKALGSTRPCSSPPPADLRSSCLPRGGVRAGKFSGVGFLFPRCLVEASSLRKTLGSEPFSPFSGWCSPL